MLRQRNMIFLRENSSVTPSQLHGHRIAAILAELVALFNGEGKTNSSESYAFRVMQYAELLLHEMVREIWVFQAQPANPILS